MERAAQFYPTPRTFRRQAASASLCEPARGASAASRIPTVLPRGNPSRDLSLKLARPLNPRILGLTNSTPTRGVSP
jgi:hypothetical protein